MFRIGIGGHFGPFWAGWSFGRRRHRKSKTVHVERHTTVYVYPVVPTQRQAPRLTRAYQAMLWDHFYRQRRAYIAFLRWLYQWQKDHPGERWQTYFPDYIPPQRPHYPNTGIPITVMKSEVEDERQVR